MTQESEEVTKFSSTGQQEDPSVDLPARVVCICGGDGFPRGSGTAVRIALVGRALQQEGIHFHLLHCGPTPTLVNTTRHGSHEGVTYEYTGPLKRPENFILRGLVYIACVLNATRHLTALRFAQVRPAVYLYVMFGPLNLYFGLLCRVLGLPLVQELCEWWPGEPTCSPFSRWLYRRAIYANATGALCITETIENRVRQASLSANPGLKIHHLPSLLDTRKFGLQARKSSKLLGEAPAFLWCGTVNGWVQDVLFLISALALVIQRGNACRLYVVGACREDTRERIQKHIQEQGLPAESVVLTGWVEDEWLSEAYRSAKALLLPLWDDDRSRTRMPNKLAEYLCSARPVITSHVGVMQDRLNHFENAYVVTPGRQAEFADAMIHVLQNPDWAARIGAKGREDCLAQFDYRLQAENLAAFFRSCMDEPIHISKSERLVQRARRFLRNLVCALFAMGLIATGSIYRARSRAFADGVITAVYFHKPNRRLFEKCVHWLRKNGYVFVSEQDVISFLEGKQKLPKGAVWLSFDDGAAQLMQDVLPVIKQEHIPVTWFIPSDIILRDGRFPWVQEESKGTRDGKGRHAITVEELLEVSQLPEITIGSHTATHAVLPWCRTDCLDREIRASKLSLQEMLRQEVRSFSYPNGQIDPRSEKLLPFCGYNFAVTTESRLVRADDNPWRIPRFSVADNLFFPEAICNLVGVWRPSIDRLKSIQNGKWFSRNSSR